MFSALRLENNAPKDVKLQTFGLKVKYNPAWFPIQAQILRNNIKGILVDDQFLIWSRYCPHTNV